MNRVRDCDYNHESECLFQQMMFFLVKMPVQPMRNIYATISNYSKISHDHSDSPNPYCSSRSREDKNAATSYNSQYSLDLLDSYCIISSFLLILLEHHSPTMAFDPGNYCKICATSLDFANPHKKECHNCGFGKTVQDREELSSAVTVAKEAFVKRWQKENAFAVPTGVNYAEIQEDCPKCGHNRLYFWTRQTRSADEGQTCYYQCMRCDFRKAENS